MSQLSNTSALPDEHDGALPIREVSRQTGVNSVTLRAWERRYGIIKPHRTAKGHRFYTVEHIQQIERILYWLDQGFPIRQIKALLQGVDVSNDTLNPSETWQILIDEIVADVHKMSMDSVQDHINNGFSNYPVSLYCQQVLLSVVQHVRTVNFPHAMRVALESTLHTYFHYRTLQTHNSLKKQPALLVVTQKHLELEATMVTYALASMNEYIQFYGADLTAQDAEQLVALTGISRVWIYGAPCNQDVKQQWQQLLENMDADCFVSGFELDAANLTGITHATDNAFAQRLKEYQFIRGGV